MTLTSDSQTMVSAVSKAQQSHSSSIPYHDVWVGVVALLDGQAQQLAQAVQAASAERVAHEHVGAPVVRLHTVK